MRIVLLFFVLLVLSSASVFAQITNYTLVSNESFETRVIGDFNTNSASWIIISTACKKGTYCLEFNVGDATTDGWAYANNATYYRENNTAMVVRGWVKETSSGGNGAYPSLMHSLKDSNDYQLSGTFFDTGDTRINNVTYIEGVRSIAQPNSSAVNYKNTWMWCRWNITATNGYAHACYTDESEVTAVLINTNASQGLYTNGSFGYGALRDSSFDAWEFYRLTPPAVAPVVTLINFTSDAPPESACTGIFPTICASTADTTPTFELNTDITAKCRIATTDINYNSMTTNCTPSDHFNTTHSCTQAPPVGAGSNSAFYFACGSSAGLNNTAPLANAHKANLTITLNSAPTVTLNTPLNNTLLSDQYNVTFNYTATDDFNTTFPCSLYTNGTFRATNTTVNNTPTYVFVSGFTPGRIRWWVNCTDTATTPLTTLAGNFSLNFTHTQYSSATNYSGVAYELNLSSYSFNITSPISFNNVNVTFNYNGTNYTNASGVGVEIVNATLRRYNINLTNPLIEVNNTLRYFNWTASVSYSDGTNDTNTTVPTNQSLLWSYFPSATNSFSSFYLETQTINVTTNITQLSPTSIGLSVNFSINGTNLSGISGLNTSGLRQISYSVTNLTDLLSDTATVTNISYNLTSRLLVNNTWLRNQTGNNIALYKMIFTNCSIIGTGNITSNVTLRYDLFQESNISTTATTNFQENYKVWSADENKHRTYNWQRDNRQNASVCIYPTIIGTLFNVREQLIAGDGSVFAFRNYDNTGTANLTQRNTSLYLLSQNDSSVSLVTIIIENTKGIVQPDLVIRTYRFFLAENRNVQVSQDVTDIDGRIREYLQVQNPKYHFEIYNSDQTELLLNTTPSPIFSTTLTYKIGQNIPRGWATYYALSTGEGNTSFNRGGNTFSTTYNFNGIPAGNYSIINYCQQVFYVSNTTSNRTLWDSQCSTSNATTITSIVINQSISDQWVAQSFVNITSPSSNNFIIDTASYNFATGAGNEGMFWTAIMFLMIVGIGIWNPAGAVFAGALFLIFGIIIGLNPLTLSSAITMGILSAIVIGLLKT